MAQHSKKVVSCPVSVVAALLSDTWTMLIVHTLLGSKAPMRFCELERALGSISTRTLTLKLKRLEEKKLITKASQGYEPTKSGRGLVPVLRAMEKFGRKL